MVPGPARLSGMWHKDSKVYLANPAVVTASAITGHVSHPEEVLGKGTI